jgi:hypothetical protein
MRSFHESQTIMPAWSAFLAAVCFTALFIFLIYEMAVAGVSLLSVIGIVLIVSIAITLIISTVLFFLRINVTVTNVSLTVGLLKGRVIPMSDIGSVSAEEFSAFRDYTGFGMRIGRKGLGYIAAGTNKGIRIHLKTGKSFLISTKRSFEFESAMRTALRNVKKD